MSLGSENGLSVADIAAVTDRNNGNCGGWGGGFGEMLIAMIMLFLFPMFFGGGMWGGGMFGGMGGWGNGGMIAAANGALTRADLCSEFNFNGLENAVRGVQQGICDSTFALNNTVVNGFNGVQRDMCTGFANINAGISENRFATQQGFNATQVAMMQNQNALQTQLADCCCKTQTNLMQLGNQVESGFCTSNYNAATNTNAIIQNAHNDTDRVLAKLDAMEMARKDETIADLRTKLAACGDQTTAQYIINQLTGVISPRAVPAYPAASPCGLGNWAPQVLANGWNGGCGCNSGCGCNGGCGC